MSHQHSKVPSMMSLFEICVTILCLSLSLYVRSKVLEILEILCKKKIQNTFKPSWSHRLLSYLPVAI